MRAGLSFLLLLVAGDDLPKNWPPRETDPAEVTRVIDGDTIVADIDLGWEVWLHGQRLRLWGIDTPERGDIGYRAAKQALEERIDGKQVRVRMVTKDSFGRWVVQVYDLRGNINDWLVQTGHAVEYRR